MCAVLSYFRSIGSCHLEAYLKLLRIITVHYIAKDIHRRRTVIEFEPGYREEPSDVVVLLLMLFVINIESDNSEIGIS
ncbi:hypothetical protein FRX31_021029 [Thalictrum thalictroides]|uniref:Uncharacterized protein n=1 Tax=Thalictrum thalictroides TaxID=46969 RepID=A0A7J6VYG6_THATH|nr:hypothetical protein FRX31_021029 [Thalictrum thalictroides]